MYLLTVAPITRGVLKGALSYFSKEPHPVGHVVFAPVQKKEVPALVIESQGVSGAKSSIKTSDYILRKISSSPSIRVWDDAFIRTAEEIARFHAGGLGETLLALTPQTILNAYLTGALTFDVHTKEYPRASAPVAIQGNTNMRMESYQRLVRESFVHGKSVFLCVSSPEAVERIAHTLGHGIETYTYALHSEIAKKRLLHAWEHIQKEPHAILVIGTPQYLALPRHFAYIIIEEEQNRGWKTLTHPLIDMRMFIENYARLTGSALILGASLLRLETHKRVQEGSVGTQGRIAAHAPKELTTVLIDPRTEEKELREKTGKRVLQVLSKNIRAIMEEARNKKERVVLITARKGLSPITVCGDCGVAVRCPVCETPLSLHARGDVRIFSCHACGFTRVPERNLNETCPQCGSWRLEALGIGTERVEKEIAEVSGTHGFVFDGDRIATRAQARKLIAQFEKMEGGVLIGTPMVIPYLTHTDHIAVISIDSLFAIPDFQMNERIFSLLLALREKAEKTLLVQTRADDTTLITQALRGDIASFVERELALRKTFSYPPYSTIVKVTVRGTQNKLSTETEKLATFLAPYDPITPHIMSKESRNVFRRNLILKLKEGAWVNEDLLTKLRALPPHYTVEINPDHLL